MKPINLFDLERLASQTIPKPSWDFIAGGADDEVTLRANRDVFDRCSLVPRMLVDVSTVSTRTTLWGADLSAPIMVAPTAFHQLAHPSGELATALACAEFGTVMCVSTLASTRLEQVADAAPGPKWFQLYCYRDRAVTESLIQRAEEHGYEAICLTVDVPRLGRRERDVRNSFSLPDGVLPQNFTDVTDLTEITAVKFGTQVQGYINQLLDDSLTWRDVEWLRAKTKLPLLIKGILSAEDAVLAKEHGVDGIIVSNHGARQLDGATTAVDVLPEITRATGPDCPVLIDGRIRRGTDVLKCLALGARAVLVGRPVFWGLAYLGEQGVLLMLNMLREELENAMALCGCPTISDVHQGMTRFAPFQNV